MVESAALIRKLQIKAGSRLWLINVPEALAEALTAGAEVETVRAGEPCDCVIAFALNPVEAERFGSQAVKALGPDGLLWMAYRKGAAGKVSALTRDTGWEPLRAAGWDTVRSVSINDEWTGLRFRPAAQIGR